MQTEEKNGFYYVLNKCGINICDSENVNGPSYEKLANILTQLECNKKLLSSFISDFDGCLNSHDDMVRFMTKNDGVFSNVLNTMLNVASTKDLVAESIIHWVWKNTYNSCQNDVVIFVLGHVNYLPETYGFTEYLVKFLYMDNVNERIFTLILSKKPQTYLDVIYNHLERVVMSHTFLLQMFDWNKDQELHVVNMIIRFLFYLKKHNLKAGLAFIFSSCKFKVAYSSICERINEFLRDKHSSTVITCLFHVLNSTLKWDIGFSNTYSDIINTKKELDFVDFSFLIMAFKFPHLDGVSVVKKQIKAEKLSLKAFYDGFLSKSNLRDLQKNEFPVTDILSFTGHLLSQHKQNLMKTQQNCIGKVINLLCVEFESRMTFSIILDSILGINTCMTLLTLLDLSYKKTEVVIGLKNSILGCFDFLERFQSHQIELLSKVLSNMVAFEISRGSSSLSQYLTLIAKFSSSHETEKEKASYLMSLQLISYFSSHIDYGLMDELKMLISSVYRKSIKTYLNWNGILTSKDSSEHWFSKFLCVYTKDHLFSTKELVDFMLYEILENIQEKYFIQEVEIPGISKMLYSSHDVELVVLSEHTGFSFALNLFPLVVGSINVLDENKSLFFSISILFSYSKLLSNIYKRLNLDVCDLIELFNCPVLFSNIDPEKLSKCDVSIKRIALVSILLLSEWTKNRLYLLCLTNSYGDVKRLLLELFDINQQLKEVAGLMTSEEVHSVLSTFLFHDHGTGMLETNIVGSSLYNRCFRMVGSLSKNDDVLIFYLKQAIYSLNLFKGETTYECCDSLTTDCPYNYYGFEDFEDLFLISKNVIENTTSVYNQTFIAACQLVCLCLETFHIEIDWGIFKNIRDYLYVSNDPVSFENIISLFQSQGKYHNIGEFSSNLLSNHTSKNHYQQTLESVPEGDFNPEMVFSMSLVFSSTFKNTEGKNDMVDSCSLAYNFHTNKIQSYRYLFYLLNRCLETFGFENDSKLSDRSISLLDSIMVMFKTLVVLVNVGSGENTEHHFFLVCVSVVGHSIDTICKNIVPFLDFMFRHQSEHVTQILKTLQVATRKIQLICSHCKAYKHSKNPSLYHIPMLKRNLETLLFKVKTLLSNNDCIDCYWIGNLKHKSISGVEISSQLTKK